MSGCLHDVAAALVDGELDHAARERAHRHLAHCAPCRAEVEAQRRLKSRLSGLGGPVPAADLSARLLGLVELGPDHHGSSAQRPDLAAVLSRRAPRRRPRPAGGSGRGPVLRPAGRSRRALRRGAGVTTAAAVLVVAAAFVLGAPPEGGPTTPVDPGTDAFVTRFVDTTGDDVAVTPAGLTGGRR